MKKILSFVAALMIATTATAQTAMELARQQQELNAINMKMLNAKPTKQAKKQAKELKAEGWTVPAGDIDIAQQVTRSQLYSAELTTDESGNVTKRYIMQTAQQTAGTYNSGYAAARAAAQTELAAMLKTELVTAMQQKLDNSQNNALTATTIDKFNQRSRMIVDQTLTNAIPVLAIYRRLPNNNFEVQVRIAFDKKELIARIKRNMQQELEKDGDKLYDIVDAVFDDKL
ncbi:hypothetical protein [Prevotella sp.]|uniref:hypothetical protein n=1 Tax=Prevotella sp. TaxID=59823 RepID=UPI0025F22E43|nr:hypothetical protein [Prevotella sp.]